MKGEQLRLLTVVQNDDQPELLCQAPLGAGVEALSATIRADAARYQAHFGRRANVVWLHPDAVAGVEVEGLSVRGRARGLAYVTWFRLGAEAEE